MSPTVFEAKNLKFKIYFKDHSPPQVHVEGKGADLINYIHEWSGQVEALLDLFQYIRKQKNQAITIMTPAHSQNLRNIQYADNQIFFWMLIAGKVKIRA